MAVVPSVTVCCHAMTCGHIAVTSRVQIAGSTHGWFEMNLGMLMTFWSTLSKPSEITPLGPGNSTNGFILWNAAHATYAMNKCQSSWQWRQAMNKGVNVIHFRYTFISLFKYLRITFGTLPDNCWSIFGPPLDHFWATFGTLVYIFWLKHVVPGPHPVTVCKGCERCDATCAAAREQGQGQGQGRGGGGGGGGGFRASACGGGR
jgi:uncharacterized membrane protein YgcG